MINISILGNHHAPDQFYFCIIFFSSNVLKYQMYAEDCRKEVAPIYFMETDSLIYPKTWFPFLWIKRGRDRNFTFFLNISKVDPMMI